MLKAVRLLVQAGSLMLKVTATMSKDMELMLKACHLLCMETMHMLKEEAM